MPLGTERRGHSQAQRAVAGSVDRWCLPERAGGGHGDPAQIKAQRASRIGDLGRVVKASARFVATVRRFYARPHPSE
jgi:hypothetical protein